MAKKNSYERQDQIQSELLAIAKRGFQTKSLVERLIEEGAERAKNKKTSNEPEVRFAGGKYNLTDEQKAEIEERNRMANAEKARIKALKKANAKAKRAQAKIDAEAAKEAAFKAMIARKAQEQIAARKAQA